MARTILFVHGRHFKPGKPNLARLWVDALQHGIQRDRPGKTSAFNNATKVHVYYGDLSNAHLRSVGREYDMAADTRDRRRTLDDLKQLAGNQFTKARYNKLPGKTALKEVFADSLARPISWFGLSETLITSVAPDMAEYWNPDSAFGSDVRARMIDPLRLAMKRGDRILVVSHSLGTMISYDTFWKFSRYGEHRDYWSKKIDLWITMGSPLGDETVKKHLKGARAAGERRYPANVRRWENVAAQDDYISHDQKVKNDFKKMLKLRLVNQLRDHRIYNLAVRHGKSNPHSSVGYLVHPKLAGLVADWV